MKTHQSKISLAGVGTLLIVLTIAARCRADAPTTQPTAFTPGGIATTNNPTDMAIQGNGFFQVSLHGRIAYTRFGAAIVNNVGELVIGFGDGCQFVPPLRVPPITSAKQIFIGEDGVIAVRDTKDGKNILVGQIQLATFADPSKLKPLGATFYQPTAASGQPVFRTPGQHGAGILLQGFIEQPLSGI